MTSAAGVGGKILVVDDEPAIREIVCQHFESLGYQVRQAGDGVTALELVADEPPQLMILDVKMPRLNGWEVARRIKKDPETAGIKIIMCSTLSNEVVDNTLPVFGGDAAIDKPFELGELESLVAQLLA